MPPLFFFGTLRFRPLLATVLGRDPQPEDATLPGFHAVWAQGEAFPMLVDSSGQAAEGVLLRDVSEAEMQRLRFYEGAFSYDLVPVEVAGPHGPEPAQVFTPRDAPWQPGAPWSLDTWIRDWGTLTRIAAGEVMRAHGRETAQEVAARLPIIRARAQAHVNAAARRRPVTASSPLTHDDVEVTRLDRPYEKFFTVEEYETRFRRFDGGWSASGARAVFNAAEAVTVLPYDPARDMVMLIEQLRMGPYALGDPQPWFLEPVAGIVDAGESHEETAQRETLEEAHLTLDALHKVAGYYPSPGGIAQYLVSYVGIADLRDERKRTGGLVSEGENIRNVLVSYDALLAMLDSGELVNAPLILTVQWLMLNRDRLRARP